MDNLGAYHQFSAWTGAPHSWGPDGRWKAWFGAGVVDELVGLIDDHIGTVQRGTMHGEPVPAAIGSVYLLTDPSIIDVLGRLEACCIVLNKNASWSSSVAGLAEGRNTFPSSVLPGLAELRPAIHGERAVIGPYDEVGAELGPVRVAGWRPEDRPLVHTKMLLLGELWVDDDEWTGEYFFPRSLWFGSANWTQASRSHLEFGLQTSDPALLNHAERFLSDVIRFSEPWGSIAVGPEPDLTPVEYDDEAFAQLLGGD